MYILTTNRKHVLGSDLYCGHGIMGNGAPGLVCGRGDLMTFETAGEADRLRMTFTQPEWWEVSTVISYQKEIAK